jgi:hypothetical protein
VIEPEAESQALKQRSLELAELLDAGHPVPESPAAVLAESRRLGAAAHQARRAVAVKVAAGLDPGCPVGRPPAVRRVRTDQRGRDLDPLHGRAVISAEIVAYWEHRRDVVAPAVEASYRQAAEKTPYRPALVAAARGHIAVLGQRQSNTEGGAELNAALQRYDVAYTALREAALDTQQIAVEAEDRLASLRREEASIHLGGNQVKGFLASVISTVTDFPVNPDTAMPLVPAGARKGQAVGRAG